MKKQALFIFFLSITFSHAQNNIDELLAAGINDAKRFTTSYLAPASEGVAFGMNNGWFNNAKSPKRFGFEISLIGNVSFIEKEKKYFQMDASLYENISFQDGSTIKNVATSLGHNHPPVVINITLDNGIFGNQEVELELPTGIGSQNINILPTAFLQAGFSPFKGTQLKARFFPKVDTEDVKVGYYGIGLQQEFTSWLPADKIFPIAISGVIAYTHLNGSYDFTDEGFVAGENQKFETKINTMLFQLLAGTKIKIINFYAGLGYITGKSNTDVLGTYRVTYNAISSEEIVDPFSVNQEISGMRTTLGANLKLGFFGLNADYTIAEFNSASLGLNFSF
ncbi:MAG TPA: DUF6588 family protein [Flavobacteriaceae bacterium]|nr:DUF6588 family protein [Flavobacteriaceae bacterium]